MNLLLESVELCDFDIYWLKKKGILYADGDINGNKIEIKYKKGGFNVD